MTLGIGLAYFDGLKSNTTTVSYRYTVTDTPTIETDGNRTFLRLVQGDSISKDIPPNYHAQKMCIGAKIRINSAPNLARAIFQFRYLTYPQIALRLTPKMTLAMYLSNSGEIISDHTAPLELGTWHQLEWMVFSDYDTGYSTLNIDKTEVLNVSGVTTRGTDHNSFITNFKLGDSAVRPFSVDYYDLYVNNTDIINDDYSIIATNPDSDSDINWNTSSGSSNFNLLNEEVPDTSTYVYSINPVIDLYTYEDIAATLGDIKGVQITSLAASPDDDEFRHIIQTNSQTFFLSLQSPTNSFKYYHDILEENPSTFSPWELSEINDIKGGEYNNDF